MAGLVTKGQLGYEDIATGTGTFTRATSVGGSQTLHQLPFTVAGGNMTILGTATSTASVLSNATLSTSTLASPVTTGTDTGAETLQNKTLNGATSGNAVTLLNQQGSASAIVGNSAAQVFFTYTLPGGTVAVGKSIRISVGWSHSTGSASVTYAISLNGTQILSSSAAGAGQTGIILDVLATAAATAVTNGFLGNTGIAWNAGVVSSGLAWASNQVLQITFNVANTDQVTPIAWKVTLDQ